MRGAEYVPKKKPKKQKKAAKVDKALGWGGFDDQVKPTEVRMACATPVLMASAARGQHAALAWAALALRPGPYGCFPARVSLAKDGGASSP